MRFLPLCIATLLIICTVFYLTRRNSGIGKAEISDDIAGNVRGKSSGKEDKEHCGKPVETRSNIKGRQGQPGRNSQGPETVQSSHLAQQATLEDPLVLAEVSYSSPFDEGSIGGHVDVPSQASPEEPSTNEFNKNEPESREPKEEASTEVPRDLPEHIPEHQEFEDEDEDPEFNDYDGWDGPSPQEHEDDLDPESDGLVIEDEEDPEEVYEDDNHKSVPETPKEPNYEERPEDEDEEDEEELGEFEEYVPETKVEEAEPDDKVDSEPVLEIPYTEVSVYYSSNDQHENGSEKEFGDLESSESSQEVTTPSTRDAEEPEEPTPVADYRSKVDSSLFTVLDSFEDNVKVLKLLARDGAVAKRVKYDGEEIWSGVRRFSTFLCSSALLYFDGDRPTLAVIKTNGLCNTEPTVYRYHDGTKWQSHDAYWHKNELEALKKKCKPTTPITLDLSKDADKSKLEIRELLSRGVSVKEHFPNRGHHISSVLDAGATVWKSSGDEKCLLAECYTKGGLKLLYLEIDSGSGLNRECFEKVGETWKEITEDDFNARSVTMIGESRHATSLNIAHPNRLLCKSFDYTIAANTVQLIVPKKGVSVSKLVNGTEEIYTLSSGETLQYVDAYLNKDGKAELVFITLRTLSGVSRKSYVKDGNGWTVCNNTDAKMKNLRDPAEWISNFEVDISLDKDTNECSIFEVDLLGITTKHFFPKPGYHAKKVKDGNRDLWTTMDRSNRCLFCLIYKHGAVELMELTVAENGSRGCILFEKLNCAWKSIAEKDFNDKFYKMGPYAPQPS
ncbi:hypothetical protein BEWA_002070 [Theileria equi strain WA]|uniref:Signal peptide containing protein n=1 Tax=Theileria equi strain WA TaxID=1537102 RepID=L0AZ10_THEEQ|nr:hypothetical protein BEWA_002070 [Theileria equi strain WA]AFZ80800.1 hypothetical protein BEWA_002070 [Theileria equi strain WA]|eukprot:XP_004830466.1 hypothetical protein BEWA_002070 [Theileria equi strain WA]